MSSTGVPGHPEKSPYSTASVSRKHLVAHHYICTVRPHTVFVKTFIDTFIMCYSTPYSYPNHPILNHKQSFENVRTSHNVLTLLAECRFWYSACSKYNNTGSHTHKHTHTDTHSLSSLIIRSFSEHSHIPSCNSMNSYVPKVISPSC